MKSETTNMSPRGKIIECGSCGAHFDEMLPKCPYCGTASIKGAEAEYMDKLEDVRSDMEDLSAVPAEETKKELKKQTKFVLIVVGIILGMLLLLFSIEVFFSYREDKRDRQADYIWQQENFPIFDELYEQGRYDEVVELYYDAWMEEKPISGWEHYEFCSAMLNFKEVEDVWAKEREGRELTHWDYEDLLYVGFRVENYLDSTAYSQEEKELMAPYIEKIRADFETRWDFTEKEQAMFEKEMADNYGYVSYDVIEDYVEDWMKRSGK